VGRRILVAMDLRHLSQWALLAALVCCPHFAGAQDAYNAGIALSPDEKTFAVGNGGREIRLYRLSDGKLIRVFSGDKDDYDLYFLTKPSFSIDGNHLTAGNVGPDGGVNPIWRISDGRLVSKAALYGTPNGGLAGNPFAFSGDGKYAIGRLYGMSRPVGTYAWKTREWRHAFYQPKYTEEYEYGVVAISPKGNLIAEVYDGNAEFWEFDGELRHRWEHWPSQFPAEISYAVFSGDGNVLVVAGDGWCGSLDWRKLPTSGILVDTSKGIDRTYIVKKSEVVANFVVRSLGTDVKGTVAFLGSRGGRIARFNLSSGMIEKSWQAFPEPVKGLVMTKAGDLLSYDLATVKVWSRDGVLRKTIR